MKNKTIFERAVLLRQAKAAFSKNKNVETAIALQAAKRSHASLRRETLKEVKP